MSGTLALSGWAQPADALHDALALGHDATLDYSAHATESALFAALAAHSDAARVIGWSLGGQLAVRAILAGVLKPKQLVLIGAPYQFLKNTTMPHGMDIFTFETFRTNYAHEPERTASRFHALVAKGDAKFKQVVQGLRHHAAVADTDRWLPWFDALGQATLHGADLSALPPTLILHGQEDAIVPIAQAEMLAYSIPNATLMRWQDVAHAPHLHDGQRAQAAIAQHWQQVQP